VKSIGKKARKRRRIRNRGVLARQFPADTQLPPMRPCHASAHESCIAIQVHSIHMNIPSPHRRRAGRIAKVGRDEAGISKGYGFVSYTDFDALDAAIAHMNGQYMMNKEISLQDAYKKDGKELEAQSNEKPHDKLKLF
jgi:RNA recognition motif-containing protein